MAVRLKVYELAKELNQESRQVLEVAQRLGINIKNPTSFIGSEEARIVRDYYKKSGPVTRRKVVAKEAPVPTPGMVTTERRVGRTVIRRRKKAAPAAPAPPKEEPVVEVPVEAAEPELTKTTKKTAAKTPSKKATTKKAKAPEPEVAPPAIELEEGEKIIEEKPKKKRQLFPSIIKKVSTDKHLDEKIGAKPAKRARPAASQDEPAPSSEDAHPKRVREINVVPATQEAKEANKRRMLQRQSGVFKSADFLKRELVRSGKKKKPVLNRPAQKTLITTPKASKRIVEMGENISVEEFAKALGIKVKALEKKLKELGALPEEEGPINIDFDTATIVAQEFAYTVKQNIFREEDFIQSTEVADKDLVARAPVVTIMGHVDHGKTSLLDKIRKTKVAEGEAGGITQHVGAYVVEHKKHKITFVDTPGHEAFTAMRARGAQVTDIVILVVSATEGPMPQTVESINHSKAAKVPLIVAVNKTDLPEANPDKTKQALANYDLAPEEWGGDTIFANVSAKTGKGIDKLLESVQLHADLLELKANPKGAAKGVIIESRMEKGRGAVATVLVQEGTLKSGDTVVCGTVLGKVRALNDFQGKKIKSAGPSEPVEIIGLSDVVEVGDTLNSMKNEKAARELIDARKLKSADMGGAEKPKLSLEEMLAAAGEAEKKKLNVVLKSDVQGSIEAVKESLSKFPTEKVEIKYLHSAVGGISENDIMLARTSEGVVFGFNVRPDAKAKRLAEQEGVDIRCYRVIYELVDEVGKLLEGLVDKKVIEKVIGHAEVREVFNVPKIGAVAGSSVTDGKLIRGCFVRLTRDSVVIYEGKCASLRRFKDDVKEVTHGHECGVGLENFNDIKNGDLIEAYEKEEIAGTLSGE